MHKVIRLAAMLAGIGLPVAVPAHHSFAAFAMEKNITVEGTLVSYQLSNPHAHMVVKVTSVDGKASANNGNWDVEGGAANIMRRQGWTARTFVAGDKVKLIGHPLRSGERGLSLFYAELPGGKRLYHDIARPKAGANY